MMLLRPLLSTDTSSLLGPALLVIVSARKLQTTMCWYQPVLFKGQTALWSHLFPVLMHRSIAVLWGMDELLTMNWNFVWRGFTSHRLHCQLLSSGRTTEAFTGHSLKPLRWSGHADQRPRLCFHAFQGSSDRRSSNTLFPKRGECNYPVLIPPRRWFLTCSQTSGRIFSSSRWKGKQRGGVISRLPSLAESAAFRSGSPVFINRQGHAGPALSDLTAEAGVIQTAGRVIHF